MQTRKKNVVQVRKYNSYYKITICNTIITGKQVKDKFRLKRGEANKVKLRNNVSRAKRVVLEKAICNDWDFFVTLTISPNKYDRSKSNL